MEKLNLNSKKIVLPLGIVYLALNFILALLFQKSSIARQLFAAPEVSQIMNEKTYIIIVIAVVAMALLTVVFMTFLYRNLLKFFFMESQSWKLIDFCYLVSVIAGVILSIIVLNLNSNIEMTTISRMTNLTTVIVLNLLFFVLNKGLKEQLLVMFVSILNAGIVMFF